MKRLIIFLIRKRLGLKNMEAFRFTNQKTNAVYYFDGATVWKCESYYGPIIPSSVSLNWLLDDACKIKRLSAADKLWL